MQTYEQYFIYTHNIIIMTEYNRTTIKKIYGQMMDGVKYDQNYELCGRIVTDRFSGDESLCFINLNDGSTVRTIQCVCDKTKYPNTKWDKLWKNISRGATLSLKGKIVKSPAKGQDYDFEVVDYDFFGIIKDPASYPLAQRKGIISRNLMRTIPHMRNQTLLFTAIEILKKSVYSSIHQSMRDLDIGEVQPTLLTGNECESGAYPFSVTTLLDKSNVPMDRGEIDFKQDFFKKRVFLTVSSQLHLEASVCSSGTNSYCMTTAFRAEPSTGPLHLAEFCMPEWELVNSKLEDNMNVAEKIIKDSITIILENYRPELEFVDEYMKKDIRIKKENELKECKELKKTMTKKDWCAKKKKIEEYYKEISMRIPLIERLERYRDTSFVVTTHEECVRLLKEHVNDKKVEFLEQPEYDGDFSKEHEFYITQVLFDGMPTFVRYYPKNIKAFYMPVINKGDEIERVDCYDLLFPYVGEVVGGSQRISDYDTLEKRMKDINLNMEELEWYLDLRKYGTYPHGGAGLGLGRLMIVLTGIHNIKDMQEFPRACGLTLHA